MQSSCIRCNSLSTEGDSLSSTRLEYCGSAELSLYNSAREHVVAAFLCYIHDKMYMYRLLVALIRKLCAIVRPILNWSSHTSVARLLNRLLSFILRRPGPLTSKSPLDDPGDPSSTILLPSATAPVTSCSPARSPRKIEEASPGPTADRTSIGYPPQADLSPRVNGSNDDEHDLQPAESRPSLGTQFVPIVPTQSGRYEQNIIV